MGMNAIAITCMILWMLFLCYEIHGEPMFRIPNTNNYPLFRISNSIIDRVNDCIWCLTLKDKIQQLVSKLPVILRLGIQRYEW